MKLYCNTMFCIVAGRGCRRQGCIAIQLGVLWQETGLPVLQDKQLCRDTARARQQARARGHWERG